MLPLSFSRVLPKVADSPRGSVGAPVSFFVRRPDATDVSESLGRFPTDGLTAMFQREKRTYPEEGKESLLVIPGARSSKLPERVEPELTTKGKPADKSKTGGGGQPVGDGDLEARWQTIKSEVQSNRCLVIGAGGLFSLETHRLFELADAHTEVCEGTTIQGEEMAGTLGSRLHGQDKKGGGEGMVQEESGAELCLQLDAAERERVMIGQSSQFTVCVDFRLQLDLDALEKDIGEGAAGSSSSVGGDMNPRRNIVRIVSCGERVEVLATVVRLSTSLVGAEIDADLAEAGVFVRGTGRGATLDGSSGNSIAPPRAEQQQRKSTLNGRTSVSHTDTPDVGDDAPAPTVTWSLDSITVRAGSYVGTVPCANRRKSQPCEVMAEDSANGVDPEPKGNANCDLTSWHALALVVNKEGEAPVLWIDGEIFPLSPRQSRGVGVVRDESEAASQGVVLGGLGGEWAMLAVKNLAVYDKVLDSQNLNTVTRVYRAWREEQATAATMDALEDERWSEEALQAVEDGRQPGEMTDRDRRPHACLLCTPRALRPQQSQYKTMRDLYLD